MSQRCSTLAHEEPLAGTAPYATAWIAVEFPGSWGKRALSDADLPAGFGAAVLDATAGTGVQVVLIRQSRTPVREHQILVASAGRMRRGCTSDPAVILDWDFAGLATGSLPDFGAPDDAPHLLICTNSARDQCCAIDGRALFTALEGQANLWESSHLGGHRFAPVVLQLPSAYVYGRMPHAAAEPLVTEPGILQLPWVRGRTDLPQPLQAAELVVRGRNGLAHVDDIVSVETIDDHGDVLLVQVTTRSHGIWQLRCTRIDLDRSRPESCGAEPIAGFRWDAEVLISAQ